VNLTLNPLLTQTLNCMRALVLPAERGQSCGYVHVHKAYISVHAAYISAHATKVGPACAHRARLQWSCVCASCTHTAHLNGAHTKKCFSIDAAGVGRGGMEAAQERSRAIRRGCGW
jgi:hypothetical protein